MSVVDGNGKGHLLISYLFQGKELDEQINEENNLKKDIASLLKEKGYKFVIVDDDMINEALLNAETEKNKKD